LPAAATFFHRTAILSAAKLTAQPVRSAFSYEHPNADACRHYYDNGDGYGYGYLRRADC
jgi:hypothetical protein